MNFEEITFTITSNEYGDLINYFEEKKIKTVKESFYKDSYFDTITSDFKKNNLELILREENNKSYILVYEIKNNGKKLIFCKKQTKEETEQYISKFEYEKIIKFLKYNNICEIKSKNFNYSIFLEVKVKNIEFEYVEFEQRRLSIYLEEIDYEKFLSYEINIKVDNKDFNFCELTKSTKKKDSLNDLKKLNISSILEKSSVLKDLDWVMEKLTKKEVSKKTRVSKYFNYIKDIKTEEDKAAQDDSLKNNSLEDFIVVVEGKNDVLALKEVYPKMNTFQTNGLGITKEQIQELKNIAVKNEKKILLITDPDAPGEIIRRRITKEIPGVYNKYIYNDNKNVNKKSKKAIGVEALSKEEIKNIFKDLKVKTSKRGTYEMKDLINLGIYENKQKRMEFCKLYNIAYGNNKKVLKQINDYNIKI